jgi:hypothetical protein
VGCGEGVGLGLAVGRTLEVPVAGARAGSVAAVTALAPTGDAGPQAAKKLAMITKSQRSPIAMIGEYNVVDPRSLHAEKQPP